MKANVSFNSIQAGIIILLMIFLLPLSLEAQHRGERAGGSRERSAPTKPAKSQTRKTNTSSDSKANVNNKNANVDNSKKNANVDNSKKNVNVDNSKTNVNVDNSKTNVNVNNSKNVNVNVNKSTVVVANPRPYARPPYVYGGHRYYCYHPYAYHPYTPFFWGPVWHPWGFFVATLAATAIIVTVANQQYHYDQGVYYVASTGGYTVVPAPVGATITTLPPGTQTVVINETTNNYYYGGTYYEKKPDGYVVVPPTAGAVVENLPEGGKEVKVGEVTYVKVGETYYQPIVQNGKNMYEVVDVKDGE